MKFCKKYEEYMQKQCQRKKLPGVGFKTLKKVLKRCPKDLQSHNNALVYFYNGVATHCVKSSSCCPDSCPVCDGTFFPSLLKEMSDVVSVFKEHAQRLLELHLASGFRKWFIWFKDRLQGNHVALIQEGEDLVTYALINAIAMRKILEKYDEDTVFDPVSLTCGHIFCYLCACKAGSVTIVDGIKAASPREKCPLCRVEFMKVLYIWKS